MDSGTVIAIVLGCAAGVGGLVAFLRAVIKGEQVRQLEVGEAWKQLARSLGATDDARVLGGRFEGFSVLVERHAGGDDMPFTRVILLGEGRLPAGLQLKRESMATEVRKSFKGEDVLVGDDVFDRAVHVTGPEDVALASLSCRARALLPQWTAFGGVLKDGNLAIDLSGEETGSERVLSALGELAALARGLSVASVPEALRANAAQEPTAAVRLRNLAALVEHHGESKDARQALETALEDRDGEVRLFATGRLEGAAAQEVLEKLVANAELPEQARALGLERLARAHPWPAVKPCVVKALYAKGAVVRRAAVKAVGEVKDASLLPDLVSMLPTRDGELAEALARALTALGGPQAEKKLVEILACDFVPARKAAIEALAVGGSLAAVEPLLPLAERGPLKDEARGAIRNIQARLGEAGAGRLSVVDERATGGEVSVPDVAAGGVKERA